MQTECNSAVTLLTSNFKGATFRDGRVFADPAGKLGAADEREGRLFYSVSVNETGKVIEDENSR